MTLTTILVVGGSLVAMVIFFIVMRKKGGRRYVRRSDELTSLVDAMRDSHWCYRTDDGIAVWRQLGIERYPSQSEFERVTGRYMKTFRVEQREIKDAVYCFTYQPIDCDNCETCKTKAIGCSDGTVCAGLLEGDVYDWGRTVGHELGHVASFTRWGVVDPRHQRALYPTNSDWL